MNTQRTKRVLLIGRKEHSDEFHHVAARFSQEGWTSIIDYDGSDRELMHRESMIIRKEVDMLYVVNPGGIVSKKMRSAINRALAFDIPISYLVKDIWWEG